MNQAIVDDFFCKGCGLCVFACPKGIMKIDEEKLNAKGHHPAYCTDFDECTGCGSCAIVCPDCAITVLREVK